MKSSDLKEYIIDNNCIDTILEDLGCGYIVKHSGYYTCSNPDGNNKNAVTVYENENLTVLNYTRNITKNKRSADIFDLVAFYKDCSFPEALRHVHSLLGLDYYSEKEELCESLQILRMLKEMCSHDDEEDSEPIKPISEQILSYYLPYGNKLFEDDGIDLEVQQEFEIGYDPQSNRITIPIRTPLGDLCGVKGRLFGKSDEYNPKYLYLERCNKSKVLYGYWQNKDYIKNNKFIFITEAEKGVMQLASMGVRNVVSTAGKTISKHQVELITRTGCTPILSYDKDVQEDELKEIASMFMDGISVYAIIDTKDILKDKESPMDREEAWRILSKECIYKIK